MTRDQELKLRTATTWIPLTLVGSIVILVMYATWALSNERAQIYGQIAQVSQDVQSLAKSMQTLTETVTKPNSLAFSRNDWIMDCLRMQIANPNWRCPYAAVSDHAKTVVQ